MKHKKILMMGPSIHSLGGVASVVGGYVQAGLFDRWPIVYLETHVEGSKLKKLIIAIIALWKLLRMLLMGEVALLHVHTSDKVSFWRKFIYIIFVIMARRPIVFHMHAGTFLQFYKDHCGELAKVLVRFVLNRAAYVVALSSQWKANLLSIVPDANVVCIFNSVTIPPERTVLPQQKRQRVLLFLGRLGQGKGTYDLLEAVARIRNLFPDVELRCGGDGELEKVVERARELGLEGNIKILGWVKGEQKQLQLDEAAIYVLPSYYEGLPMGVLEAMAAGVPVITTTVGGIPDVIETSVDGLLIEPGDVDALAVAIEMLLGNADLRTAMGVAAKEKIVERFSAERVLPHLEEIYLQLGAVPVKCSITLK
ncbi:glycosyltransferase family 4 protein [Sulfurirhabdus autotrophica]|uniref:Glycosyltransferase involved in cell wall biosynthesis n=1 Tax=Sulfurirhabdus autotrophica TaxID=1706046 RepID=A0A4R3XX48_9PROT|nr:glycosyltransferase family 4 protein [Sulfurirhabdus autotrophica]TCV83441.1 glycosyltransferase involved in cell wall biosynthesis [Sulfurirhabdus autotrophica]